MPPFGLSPADANDTRYSDSTSYVRVIADTCCASPRDRAFRIPTGRSLFGGRVVALANF